MFEEDQNTAGRDSLYSRIHTDLSARQENQIANTVVRELDRLYDRVSHLHLNRRESVRSFIAAAGMLLRAELTNNHANRPDIDPTARELIAIALDDLSLKLKD